MTCNWPFQLRIWLCAETKRLANAGNEINLKCGVRAKRRRRFGSFRSPAFRRPSAEEPRKRGSRIKSAVAAQFAGALHGLNPQTDASRDSDAAVLLKILHK